MSEPWQRALLVGLSRGLAFSLFMTALIGVSLRQDPRIWERSAPADVRARMGPPDERTRRLRRGWGVVMLAGMIGLGASVSLSVGAHGPLVVFATTYLAFQVFNLWDAVVIDLPLVLLRPRWAFPPGTEDSPAYRDPRWHLANYGKGFLVGLPFAGVATALDAAARFATS